MTIPQTVWIYGDIGGEVESQPIVEQLAALPDMPVDVRINSGGGSTFEGSAIFNALQQHRAPVNVYIDGIAASAASYIAMAGDDVAMADNALMMIHDPWVGAGGNARDLRQSAELLDKVSNSMQRAYAAKSGMPLDRVKAIMAAETWYTAEEAQAAGFVDRITGALDVAASIDLSAFGNVPAHIQTRLYAMADKATGPQSAKNTDPQTAAAALDDFKAKEQSRRQDIRSAFAAFRSQPGVSEVEQACIDDMECSADAARTRLLNKIGQDAEPLGTHQDEMFGNAQIAPVGGGSRRYSGSFSRGQDGFIEAATDGMLLRYGIPLKDPHPAARDFRGCTVRDLAAACLSRHGRTVTGEGADGMIQAALTTSDLPALTENIAHKALIHGLESEGATTHRDTWTRSGSVSDFKKSSRVALSEAPDLEIVKEDGEITEGGMSDTAKETIQAETYARMVSISRKALINDDLGQLTRVPQAMGMAAARKESDLVYQLLADNPTMRDGNPLFDSSHGNVAATGSAITTASLGEARAALRKQRGIQGLSYLNVTPHCIVVGADRETEALQIVSSIQPNMTSSVVPEWIRQLTVVVDPRIDDFAGGAWFLTGNPHAHDTFEVVYLDGQSTGQLRQHEDFNTLNLRWRVVFDMGVAAIDWHAMYMNPGA
ncbi:ClpP-like prohead protease/major capsid protein fusion protein [Salinisphaera sp. SWV1]|uniref:ClpP-like prohead protease/major capsid protein fusion protein n=1 Tax=Salinisphaera sp. SWV1 TaxID=3454139 RepID=UPI003F85CCF2